jgi:ATP-dependent DNA helicase RecG
LAIIDENNEITYDELAERLGMARRTLSREIKALHESGQLTRVGSTRGGHWEIQSL